MYRKIFVRIFRLGTSCSAFSDFSNDVSPDVAQGQNNPFNIYAHVPHGDGLAQVLHLFPQTTEIVPQSQAGSKAKIQSC